MLDYLFRSIPGILFEPFAVFMLLWLTVVSICFPRKEKVMFRFIFFSLIFMVAWRLGFHRIMLSSRYASGLIVPVIVCSAWLCIKIPPFIPQSENGSSGQVCFPVIACHNNLWIGNRICMQIIAGGQLFSSL